MKIAISATRDNLDSTMDVRFGRAGYFIIYDTETKQTEMVRNSSVSVTGGAGIAPAQMVADRKVGVVITGNVGPKAMDVLLASGIKIFRGSTKTVRENIEYYANGVLVEITSTVPPHSRMGGK